MPCELPDWITQDISPEPNTGCWLWSGDYDSGGYGRINIGKRKRVSAHRLIYEFYNGMLPNNLVPDHLCNVPCCVNPAHMEPVSQRINVLRGTSPAALNATKTHCPHGHSLVDAYHIKWNNSRQCSQCGREKARRAYYKRVGKPMTTPANLVEEYIKLRDHKKAESDRFATYLKPYVERMQEIENQFLDTLNKQGIESFRTDAGTAYKAVQTNVKITDREKFLDFVEEKWDEWGNQMLQLSAPQKDAVKQFLQDNNGQVPPGVEVSYFTTVNIRRS